MKTLPKIKAQLDTIIAAEGVTPGPWLRDPGTSPMMQVIAHHNEVVVYHHQHNRQKDSRVVANHEWIAASRTLCPEQAKWILKEIEWLEGQLSYQLSLGYQGMPFAFRSRLDQICAEWPHE